MVHETWIYSIAWESSPTMKTYDYIATRASLMPIRAIIIDKRKAEYQVTDMIDPVSYFAGGGESKRQGGGGMQEGREP